MLVLGKVPDREEKIAVHGKIRDWSCMQLMMCSYEAADSIPA